MSKYGVEVLSKSHDRKSFDCGDSQLNAFLKKNARQQIEKGTSRTFVLVKKEDSTQIIAFSTLTICEIESHHLSEKWQKKFPRRIPGAKLARLAVDLKHQKKGFGQILLVDAMKKTINVSMEMGVVGLFVDAKHDAARRYYEQFGFVGLPDRLQNLFLPIATLRDCLADLS